MELLGREEELLLLRQYLDNKPARNLILHGMSGTGKSYFLKKIQEDPYFGQTKYVVVTILDSLAPAQAFLFETMEVLLDSLGSSQLTIFMERVRGDFDPDFSIRDWCQNYDSSYMESGFLFLKLLKAMQETIDEKIVIAFDQVENLSRESRLLLKNILEWKPEQTHFLLGLTTSAEGKQSIQRDYETDFFFKANQYLELRVLNSALKDVYCAVYGIDEPLNEGSYMSWALEQKRIWLLSQCSTDSLLKKLCVFLAHFPSGILHEQNPYLEEYLRYLSRQPLLKEIFQSQGERLYFSHFIYCEAMMETFESIYLELQDEALEVLAVEDLPFRQIVKEIESTGLGKGVTLENLLHFYSQTLSFSTLEDLVQASLEQEYPQELKNRLSIFIDLVSLAKFFDEEKARQFLPAFQALETSEKLFFGRILFQVFKRNTRMDFFSECFLSPEWIGREQDLLARIFFERIRCGEDLNKDHFEVFSEVMNKQWLQELQEILSGLADADSCAREWDTERFPMLGHYLSALYAMERQEFSQACVFLKSGLKKGLLEKDFSLYSLMLTRLSECHAQMGDLDLQLSVYREAVIAEQFLC